VLVADADHARALGVPEHRMVHVWGGAGARDAVDVLARPSFARSDALASVLDRALSQAGVAAADLDVVDVYSCFPVVPKLVAAHLGIPPPPGVTGGHSAFGGPLSSYTLHALVAVAGRCRGGARLALVHGNGGYLTHQHALLLAREPHPARLRRRPGAARHGRAGAGDRRRSTARRSWSRRPPWSTTATGGPGRGSWWRARRRGRGSPRPTRPGDGASARALSLEHGEVVGRRVRATSVEGHVEVA
jgi:acetyl-CoA C-acetyltransferase